MNTAYIGLVLEKSKIPIDERISKVVTEKVRRDCCANNQCEGLCNVKMYAYKMLYHQEWIEYIRGN